MTTIPFKWHLLPCFAAAPGLKPWLLPSGLPLPSLTLQWFRWQCDAVDVVWRCRFWSKISNEDVFAHKLLAMTLHPRPAAAVVPSSTATSTRCPRPLQLFVPRKMFSKQTLGMSKRTLALLMVVLKPFKAVDYFGDLRLTDIGTGWKHYCAGWSEY